MRIVRWSNIPRHADALIDAEGRMADEEVDFEEAVDLGDAPMEESADSGKKGRDATGRRFAIRTLCLPWLHFLLR
jgi:hypothetical protein